MPLDFRDHIYNINTVEELVSKLNDQMRVEGYSFMIDEKIQLANDFKRVYIGGGSAGYGNYNMFLDLRLGMQTPKGRAIEMATSNEGTYGIPGFARHIMGEQAVGGTYETFQDFLRSTYSYASENRKSPGSAAWIIYQRGHMGYNYPGAEQLLPEEERSSIAGASYPKGGIVLGPSTSTGKRAFMSQQVRAVIPGLTPEEEAAGLTYAEKSKGYYENIIESIRVGNPPRGLEGYIYSSSRYNKAWEPSGTRFSAEPYGITYQRTAMVYEPTEPGKVPKYYTNIMNARELSNVPLIRNPRTGQMERLPITSAMAETPGGLRKGWTQSSIVMPGESAPRVVFSKALAVADQPDMPGAMMASAGAFNQGRQQIAAIGEEGNITYNFGITSAAQLENLLQHNLTFRNLQGAEMEAGTGMYQIGKYQRTPEELEALRKTSPGGRKVREYEPLLISKKGYSVALERPTLHIPEFYDPLTEDKLFSNLPRSAGGQPARTDAIIERLKQLYSNQVNIVQYSSKGTTLFDRNVSKLAQENQGVHAGLVYMTIPMEREVTPGAKQLGAKAYPAQTGHQYEFKMFGQGARENRVRMDFVTQEGKLPSRLLMSSFGIMDMNTQQEFVDMFLPQKTENQKRAVSEIKQYIESAYQDISEAEQPAIRAEQMANIWNKNVVRSEGQQVSADMLFATMGQNILAVRDKDLANTIRSKFGIGILAEQFAPGNIYSKSGMDETNRLIAERAAEVSKANPEAAKSMLQQIRWQPYNPIGRLASQVAGDVKQPLYQMYYKVPGHSNLSMQAGLSFVPEYPSQSGYVNTNSIMSLIQNYPRLAEDMGLRNIEGDWAGNYAAQAYPKLQAPPVDIAAGNLLGYLGLQADITEGKVSIPGDVVPIDSQLASKLLDIHTNVQGMPHREQMSEARRQLADIDPESIGLKKGTHLEDTFMMEVRSRTLIPPIKSVMSMEKYDVLGNTETYLGSNWMRLLKGSIDSASSEPGTATDMISDMSSRFYNRINNMFYPGGRRSKSMFRHIIGQELPGMRGSRYQGMTELESGNAYASDRYITRLLSNNAMYSRQEIDSLMKYLDTAPDAYLPILAQRYPTVSGQTDWLPVKLRTMKNLLNLGVPVPTGLAAEDVFFISNDINRYWVGDYDADFAKTKVLPMVQLRDEKNKLSGVWNLKPEQQAEFSDKFGQFFSNPGEVDRRLKDQFSGLATSFSKEGLDISRKSLFDYWSAISNVSSFKERLTQAGKYPVADVLDAFRERAEAKKGMGVSWNMAFITKNIARAVLGEEGVDEKIYAKAYEADFATYQMYLDLTKRAKGGFTSLETMMNTWGIQDVREGENGQLYYRISNMVSRQGQPTAPRAFGQPESRTPWVNQYVGTTPNALAANAIYMTSHMPTDLMTNEQLAWGWSAPGKSKEVLETLNQFKGAERGDALTKMLYQTGEVSLRSPYFLTLNYANIKRSVAKVTRTSPDLLPRFMESRFPWINGQSIPIKDIVASREYRDFDTMMNLFIKGTEAPRPEDLERLKGMHGPRLQGMLAGIYEAVLGKHGGVYPAEEAQREFGARWGDVRRMHDLNPENLPVGMRFNEEEPFFYAGGGDDIANRIIRVGEGGPEDIILSKRGVKIVPTSQLPENRSRRGEGQGQVGLTDSRMRERLQGGEFDEFGNMIYPESASEQPGGMRHFEPGEEYGPGELNLGAINRATGISPNQPTPPPRRPRRQNPTVPVSPIVGAEGGQSPQPPVMGSGLPPTVPPGQTFVQANAGREPQGPPSRTWDDVYSALDHIVGAANGLAERFGNILKSNTVGRAPEERMNQFVTESGKFLRMYQKLPAFEQQARGAYEQILTEAGYGSELEQFNEMPHAAQLQMMAEQRNVPQEIVQRGLSRAGVLQTAKELAPMSRVYSSLRRLVGPEPWTFRSNLMGQEIPLKSFDEYQRAVGTPEGMNLLNQTMPVAQGIANQAAGIRDTERNRRFGVSADLLAKEDEARQSMVEGITDYSKAIADGSKGLKEQKEVQARATEYTKARLQVDISRQQALAGPLFTPEGQYVPRAQLEAGGVFPTTEQETAASRAFQLQGQLARGGAEGGAGSIGKLSRRMLGGFGLMYMQSIGNIILSPTQMGYQQSLQEQTAIQAGIGARFGGMVPFMNPEQQVQRAEAIYGGTGYANLRQMQAQSMATQPSLWGALGMGGAAVGAIGGLATLGMWFGAPIAAPVLGAVGAVAGLATAGINIAGAVNQPEKSAVTLAAQQLKGVNFGQGGPGTPTIGQAFNWANWGAAINKWQGGNQTLNYLDVLNNMQKQQQSGKDVTAYLRSQGYAQQQINQFMSMYTQAQAANYPNIPIEGIAGAQNLTWQYNLALTGGQYGGFASLASQISQGIPVEQLAQQVAWTPSTTWQQQQQTTGQLLQQWGNQGLTQQQITQYQGGLTRYQQLGALAPPTGVVQAAPTPEQVTNTLYALSQSEQFKYPAGMPSEKTMQVLNPNLGQLRQAGEAIWNAPGQPWEGQYWQTVGGALGTAGQAFATTQVENPRWTDYEKTAAAQSELQHTIGLTRLAAQSQEKTSQEDYLTKLNNLTEQQYQAMLKAFQNYTDKVTIGLQAAIPELDSFAKMTTQQAVQSLQQSQAEAVRVNLQQQMYQNYQQLGVTNPALEYTQAWTTGQLGLGAQATNFGVGLQGALMMGGTTPRMAEIYGRAMPRLEEANPQLYGQVQAALQGTPLAMAALINQQPALAYGTIPGAYGQGEIPMQAFAMQYGINTQGQITGLPYGRANLYQPGRSISQVESSIWGPSQLWEEKGYNPEIIQGLMTGGTRWAESQQRQAEVQYQQAQTGIQYEQLQLQKWYMPQVFGIQTEQRQLGYAQQQWSFGQQQQQLGLAQQNFAFNTAMQQQQTGMQRSWTQQDWAYQSQVRGLQWGWKQEDYAENLRFMTGRERRLAERQMGRETILHDLEGEQITKTRDRQKELWAMEDRRFTQQIAYQQSLFQMQQENLNKQQEFFQQNKDLQERSAALSEEYWRRSMALQEKSLGAQTAYQQKLKDIYDTTLPLNIQLEDANAAIKMFTDEGLAPLLELLIKYFPDIASAIQQARQASEGGGGTGNIKPRQFGGRVNPGESYLIEAGMSEIFKPDTAGTIRPLDPWGTTFVNAPTTSHASEPIRITLYLGDEKLIDRYVDAVDQEIHL